jgi:N6-adenosine-specific RNA methylase IME4
MTQRDAEEYTQALGQVVAGGWRQIALGLRLGVPKTLGLTTDQWVKQRLGGYVKYSVGERQEAVKALANDGLGERKIVGVLGIDRKTVREDLGKPRNGPKGTTRTQTRHGIPTTAGPKGTTAPLDVLTGLAAMDALHEASAREMQRAAKEKEREARRETNRELVARIGDPDLGGARFATLVIDPPWDWGDEGDGDQLGRARPTYATMTFDDVREYPVAPLADVDAHCYLWITNRSLPKGFALLETWGFRYVTCLTWCKPSIGMGNYFRGSTEQVLFGIKGSQPLKRRDVGTWFSAPREGEHSTKPDAFFALVQSCSPGPYLELFSRHDRPGWQRWPQ